MEFLTPHPPPIRRLELEDTKAATQVLPAGGAAATEPGAGPG
jgi:hypothetical protein